MRKFGFLILFVGFFALLGACTDRKTEPAAEAVDTMGVLVTRIQQCSRLYTTDCHIHKIITHDDKVSIKGEFLREKIDIDLPFGQRRIAIPMDATVKAYIDFGNFSERNVQKDGDRLTVILPDPKIVLTGTRISHDEVRRHVPWLRSNFSDAELTDYERQGREAIVKSLPQLGLTEKARQSAAHTLIPLFASMGYQKENVTITFRKDFDHNDWRTLLEQPKS